MSYARRQSDVGTCFLVSAFFIRANVAAKRPRSFGLFSPPTHNREPYDTHY